MRSNHILSVSVFMILLLAVASSAYVANAQLNNKPFQFKSNIDGNIGMSVGGKQAILDQKNLGITPNTLLRGTNGVLLNVTEGVGKSAIVTYQGEALTAYKGTSYKGGNKAMSVGTFNRYFASSSDTDSNSYSYNPYYVSSSETVSTWTTRVATDGYPASYSPGSVVDKWTSLVFIK